MDKPSCGTCRHWNQDNPNMPDWGTCELINKSETDMVLLDVYDPNDDDRLFVNFGTKDIFHCAHWEERTEDHQHEQNSEKVRC